MFANVTNSIGKRSRCADGTNDSMGLKHVGAMALSRTRTGCDDVDDEVEFIF